MAVRISRAVHEALMAHAAAAPGHEVCGLLLGRDAIEAVVPAINVAADPARSFEIDPATLFAAIRAERAGGPSLRGYYHSHPSGPPTPSPRDRAGATCDGRIWAIIGEGRIAAWRLTAAGIFEAVPLMLV